MQLTLFFLCGLMLVSALTMGTTRKVNSLRNIHVEMPIALQTLFGIDGEESVGLLIMKYYYLKFTIFFSVFRK